MWRWWRGGTAAAAAAAAAVAVAVSVAAAVAAAEVFTSLICQLHMPPALLGHMSTQNMADRGLHLQLLRIKGVRLRMRTLGLCSKYINGPKA